MLRWAFEGEGEIIDIFISFKVGRFTSQPFAFTRFRNEEEAELAIRNKHGVKISGCKITVKRAHHARKTLINNTTARGQEQEDEGQEGEKPEKIETTQRSSEEDEITLVLGEVMEENKEWLKRSIVGCVKTTRNVSLIADRVMRDWRYVEKVRDMGSYKFLVTFDTVEDMEEALKHTMDMLLNVFDSVERWSESEVCDTWRV